MNNQLVINVRKAIATDVPEIVRLLADDQIGAQRENYKIPLPEQYYLAFEQINADKNNCLVVAEFENKIIGTLQITFLTYLTYQGGRRALIEGVRTDKIYRGKGIGKMMIKWAITKSHEENCHMVQLTTDKKRAEALKFYTDLGFVASHEGLKLHLK